MARRFRFYGKKRGSRRTGSSKRGSAGEALFWGAFLAVGCLGMWLLVVALVIPEWKANHEFVRGTCLVLEARVGEKQGDDGPRYRPEIEVEYEVEGQSYRIWTYDIHTITGNGYAADADEVKGILTRFPADERRPLWYNPADPNQAVLARGSSWWVWLTLIVPISFLLIGLRGLGISLLAWGSSAERRAMLAGKAAHLDPFVQRGKNGADFPNVPIDANITDSPGTTLAFRLPIAKSPGWTLVTWFLVAVVWNAIVALFVAVAVISHLEGNPDWFWTLFISPFVLIGIGLIGFFVRQLAVTTGIGPTLVEISHQPLHPGGEYRLFLSQTGRLNVNSIELTLACDEVAIFQHGTDTRVESRRVFEQSVFRLEDFEVTRGVPFETAIEIVIPLQAMHSFKSAHNEVSWKLVVKGSAAGWPDFERSFPVIVCPRNVPAANDGRGTYPAKAAVGGKELS